MKRINQPYQLLSQLIIEEGKQRKSRNPLHEFSFSHRYLEGGISMKMLRISLLLGLLLILTTSVAGADTPHPGPAMFLDFPDCWVFDVDFNWYYIEDCSPTISLITNSNTGVLHWHAQAQLPANAVLPDQGAYQFTYENSGFACWWEEGVETTNYSITITPNGIFNISCHFRPDKWQPD